MSRYPTAFTEANALLAVVEGDIDTAREIVATMLPGEQRSLLLSVHTLSDLLNEAIELEAIKTDGRCGRWQSRTGPKCEMPLIGYTLRRKHPVGVCSVCKPVLDEEGVEVLSFPEVQL